MTCIFKSISQTKNLFCLLFNSKLYIREAYLKDYFMLNRLKTYWKETAAVAVVAAGAAFGSVSPVHAGETANGAAENHPVYEFIQQEPQPARIAFRSSAGKIVLHYGEGVQGVPSTVWSLRNTYGYPTIAIAGGPQGKVEVFVDRVMLGEFTQRDIDRDTVGGMASVTFDKRLGKPSGPLASLN